MTVLQIYDTLSVELTGQASTATPNTAQIIKYTTETANGKPQMLTMICPHHIGSMIMIINELKLCNKTVLIKTAATGASHHTSLFPLMDGNHKLLTAESSKIIQH
jgi:hypothetical protein